jgi:hypothetical protein
MALYQIVIMLIFMYFGEMMMFKTSFNLVTAPERDQETGVPLDPLVLQTMQFYIFVLMNLFNQFNCRIVEEDKFNIFSGLITNYFFIFVVAFEFFLTFVMVDIGATTIGSSLIGTADLNGVDHVVCWCVGASTLLWGAILKKIPLGKFESIEEHINLEDEEGGALNALHNKANDHYTKARNSIGVGPKVDLSVMTANQTVDHDEDDDEEHTGDDNQHHDEPSDEDAKSHRSQEVHHQVDADSN